MASLARHGQGCTSRAAALPNTPTAAKLLLLAAKLLLLKTGRSGLAVIETNAAANFLELSPGRGGPENWLPGAVIEQAPGRFVS